MRYWILLLLLAPQFSTLSGQTNKRTLQRLRNENDSLRMALEKCQSGTSSKPFESFSLGENSIQNRTTLHEKLLPSIRLKSEGKYSLAVSIIASTDTFLAYCESIRSDLIGQTGGLNPETGQPIGYRDKKAPIQYFITEKRGAELKFKIDGLRKTYLKSIQSDPYWENQIVLKTQPVPVGNPATSWEVYIFKGMPVAAVLPIIGKYQSDAAASEAAILNFINQ